MTTTARTKRRSDPGPGEMIFQTKHLRRDLHARLHIVKARRNATLPTGAKTVGLDVVLNDAIAEGLTILEQEYIT